MQLKNRRLQKTKTTAKQRARSFVCPDIRKKTGLSLQTDRQPCEIIVVDSASDDRTAEICKEDGDVRLIRIEREDFDHGGTRDMAFRCSIGETIISQLLRCD